MTDEEARCLALINDYRAANGLPSLTPQPNLEFAAQGHAQDLATHNLIGHIGSDGRSQAHRIEQAGYHYEWCGENIFWGSPSAGTAFAWWQNSPEHNDNMLFPHFNEIGIHCAFGPGTQFGHYWVTTFGLPLGRDGGKNKGGRPKGANRPGPHRQKKRR